MNDIEVKCPQCGNTGKGKHVIYHVEWAPVYRRLEGTRTHSKAKKPPVLYLDYDDAYNALEDGKDAMFQCGDCDAEWTVPRRAICLDASSLKQTRFSEMKDDEDNVA